MKKITFILLSVLMIILLASCSDNDENTSKDGIDLSNPELSITECFNVPYQYDLSPYIDISEEDYIGVEIPKVDMTVTDEDINNAIFTDLQTYATYREVERGAEVGDTLIIDITGLIDGIEFDGGTAENQEFVLGSADFIPGFEDGLIGHAVGEEFTIDVTVPEDYSPAELSGKNVQFAIKMKSVKEQILPDFNEAFIKEHFDCDTVESYLALKQEELIAAKSSEAEFERQSAAFEALYAKIEIKKYPDAEYEFYYNDFVNFYTDLAKNNYNMDLETYITDYCNSTEEEFYKYASMNAAISVEQELICFAIANEQKLWQGLKKADYDAFLERIAKEQGVSAADYESAYGSDSIWISLILDETLQFIVDNAIEIEITDKTETSDIVNTDVPTDTEEKTE